jgi:UDP:flavonoid glycosyltransferase YjiC (YdhE family)
MAHAYAKQVGLDIDWTSPFPTMSELAWLTQTPKEFDFESSHWPSQFHYTGPFHDGFGRMESDFPWARLTGEPLIFASMGTLQNGLESVFRTNFGSGRDPSRDAACAFDRSGPRS